MLNDRKKGGKRDAQVKRGDGDGVLYIPRREAVVEFIQILLLVYFILFREMEHDNNPPNRFQRSQHSARNGNSLLSSSADS